VRSRSVYEIEDLRWQDDQLEGRSEDERYFKTLSNSGEHSKAKFSTEDRSMFKQRWINCGLLIDSPVRDALAFLIKK
jgi:hypothetical protein